MPEKLSSLKDVYKFAGSAEVLPPFDVVSRKSPPPILALLARDERQRQSVEVDESAVSEELCAREIALTWQSIRSGGRPSTIVHALVLADNLSAPRLSAILREDVVDIGLRLDALCDRGIVETNLDNDGSPTYMLTGLADLAE